MMIMNQQWGKRWRNKRKDNRDKKNVPCKALQTNQPTLMYAPGKTQYYKEISRSKYNRRKNNGNDN